MQHVVWATALNVPDETGKSRPTASVRSRLFPVALVVTAGLTLSGCAYLKPDKGHAYESAEQVSRIDEHSSFPVVSRSTFERVNLVELVEVPGPSGKRISEKITSEDIESPDAEKTKWKLRLLYDEAFRSFRESPLAEAQKRIHRNSVQDRILAVAVSRCNVFKTYLRRKQSDTNFYLGTGTTVAGVLGAVIPGTNAARNLSGVAGILSGAQAEFNASYYANLAAQVIVQGIESVQQRQLTRIMEHRKGLSVNDYSMEAAVMDAIAFDGTCSVVTGLIEASESVREVNNPGIGRAHDVMVAVRAMAEVSQSKDFKSLADGDLDKLTRLTRVGGAPLVVSMAKSDPGSDLAVRMSLASTLAERLGALRAEKVAELTKTYREAAKSRTKDFDEAKEKDLDTKAKAVSEKLAARLTAETGLEKVIVEKAYAACLGEFRTLTAQLGGLQLTSHTAAAGTAERVESEAKIAAATGSVNASLIRLALVEKRLQELIVTTAASWLPQVKDAAFTADKVDALPAPDAKDKPLESLCGTATKP